MATLKERSDNWNATSLIHRDHRHDKGDGYEETPHKKVSKKETPRKKPGCRGNDNKNHVYVWIGARFIPNAFGVYVDKTYDKFAYRGSRESNPFYRWLPWKTKEEHIAWLEAREIQICAGCYKTTGKKRMKDDHRNDTSWWHWY
jgi:hypothetical protein